MIDGFTRVLQTASDLRVLLGLVRGAPCSSCLHPLRRAVLLPGRRTDRGPELTTPLDVEGRRRLVQHEQIRIGNQRYWQNGRSGSGRPRASPSPDRRVLRCR